MTHPTHSGTTPRRILSVLGMLAIVSHLLCIQHIDTQYVEGKNPLRSEHLSAATPEVEDLGVALVIGILKVFKTVGFRS